MKPNHVQVLFTRKDGSTVSHFVKFPPKISKVEARLVKLRRNLDTINETRFKKL